jgi:hypothetical protein
LTGNVSTCSAAEVRTYMIVLDAPGRAEERDETDPLISSQTAVMCFSTMVRHESIAVQVTEARIPASSYRPFRGDRNLRV